MTDDRPAIPAASTNKNVSVKRRDAMNAPRREPVDVNRHVAPAPLGERQPSERSMVRRGQGLATRQVVGTTAPLCFDSSAIRTARFHRLVGSYRYLVAFICTGRTNDRLGGQSSTLPVVRRMVLQGVAALSGDDVENSALNVAELGGGSDCLELHFPETSASAH